MRNELDDYYTQIDFETMSEEQYSQMPLRRKLLFELEDKLDIEIPSTRKYNRKAYREGTVYLTNEDLVTIVRGVLQKLDREPRHPLYVLREES